MLRRYKVVFCMMVGIAAAAVCLQAEDAPPRATLIPAVKVIAPATPAVPATKVVPAESAADTTEVDPNQIFKNYELEQKKAAESLQKVRDQAPFQQSREIALSSAQERILGFCVLPNDSLVVVSGTPEVYGELPLPAGVQRKETDSRLQWLDPEGKVQNSVTLDFKPKAVNAAKDGSVFVVGQGNVARFDGTGKRIAQAQSPHITEALASREKFETSVMERHDEEVAGLEEQVKQNEEALKELAEKPKDQLSKLEQREMLNAKAMVQAYGQMVQRMKGQTRAQVIEKALTQLKEMHRVAVSPTDVFVVTREATGYGYCIWRMNHDLADSKKIMSGLSGCCGQMDIQIAGDGLAIAENSRHRVVLIDRDGKPLGSFGKTSRTDVTKGFGGCCNPMNTCFSNNGELLTSESNGLVKRYSLAGEFQAVLGVAKVTEGCKNSSIGISAKGDRLYYFDVQKGQILVLTKPS